MLSPFCANIAETLSYLKVLAALDCLGKASVILPAWVSFSIKDGASLCGGEAIEEAVRAVVSHPMFKSGRVVAIGVNCCNPDNVTQALTAIRSVTKTTPLVVFFYLFLLIQNQIFVGLGCVVRVGCQK